MDEWLASAPEETLRLIGDSAAFKNSQLPLGVSPWFRLKDVHVSAARNLAEIRQTLVVAGNSHVSTVELRGLNHLFQTTRENGAPAEYSRLDETMAPLALSIVDGSEENIEKTRTKVTNALIVNARSRGLSSQVSCKNLMLGLKH